MIRDAALAIFAHVDSKQEIKWHRHAGHGCSSQACCVNFLFPLAQNEALLTQWVEHITGNTKIKLTPIELRHGQEQLIAFEWFPETDYLNESVGGQRSRGANSTSVDAALTYTHRGLTKLLLIEWKYIETYSNTRAASHKNGDPTRDRRYHNLWKRPHGPIKSETSMVLQDFYLDPWYQLLRQQMLAYHAECDPLSPYDHATVIHISPRQNEILRRVQGDHFRSFAEQHFMPKSLHELDRFQVFKSLLAVEWTDRFESISTADAFHCFTHEPHIIWLRDRYRDLF